MPLNGPSIAGICLSCPFYLFHRVQLLLLSASLLLILCALSHFRWKGFQGNARIPDRAASLQTDMAIWPVRVHLNQTKARLVRIVGTLAWSPNCQTAWFMLALLAERLCSDKYGYDVLVSVYKFGRALAALPCRQQVCLPAWWIRGVSAGKLDCHARLIYIFQYIAEGFHK